MARDMDALQLEVTTRVIQDKAILFYIREEFQDTHKKLVQFSLNSSYSGLDDSPPVSLINSVSVSITLKMAWK